MGYMTFHGGSSAVEAAEQLLGEEHEPRDGSFNLKGTLPLLIDQVAAEAGLYDPDLAEAAVCQARGDIARATALLRAWAAVLPRLTHNRVRRDQMRIVRRLTPAFRDPPEGQYLGASQDFARRLLRVDGDQPAAAAPRASEPNGGPATLSGAFRRALEAIEEEGLVNAGARSEAFDRTREADDTEQPRGGYLHFLCGAETGAMTAMAYSAGKDFGARREPTLSELDVAMVPISVLHPRTRERVEVGEIPLTYAEYVVYIDENDGRDGRLVLGVGATLGRVERRALSVALLDATASREAAAGGDALHTPAADAEFLKIVLDGQEASGFVEHYKLPHHVPFESKLDRLRPRTSPTHAPSADDQSE